MLLILKNYYDLNIKNNFFWYKELIKKVYKIFKKNIRLTLIIFNYSK